MVLIGQRSRLQRLEERVTAKDSGKSVVAVLEAARRSVATEITLSMQHWPARDELERHAARGCPVSEARLRLWDWPA